MPDTKPTPTVSWKEAHKPMSGEWKTPDPKVIASDTALAKKWQGCGRPACYGKGEAAMLRDRMAAEIAAAREAWGVSREAVAGLVEAGKAFFAEDSWCAFAEMHDATATECPCGYVQLRAALERVKGVGA